MKILTRKIYVFVQITKDSIIIAHGKKWGNNILLNYSTSHILDNQEVTSNAISNPTKIVSLINQEINKHHIKKGVIIATVSLLNKNHILATLQVILALSKCNIPLIYLTDQPLMPSDMKKVHFSLMKKENNKLNCMLPKHYQTASWWLSGAIMSFCFLVIILNGIHNYYAHQKKEADRAFCTVSYKANNCNINDMSKKKLSLEKETQTIEQTLSIIKQSSKNTSQLDMLVAIAKATPTNSWLENLSLTNTTSDKTGHRYEVDITGCTSSPQETSDIINHLSQSYALNTLSLKKIQQQEHNKRDEPLYVFVIKGELGEKKG